MVRFVLLRPLRPELDGQDPFQISGLLCPNPADASVACVDVVQILGMELEILKESQENYALATFC
jgi:hypothetical protein